MENAIVMYEAGKAEVTSVRRGNGYLVSSPISGNSVELNRGTDFGMIPKAKKPTLFKSGAEKVCMAYGLMQRYYIESKIENVGGGEDGDPFFFYSIKCELVKLGPDGKEYIFTSGYGSANTKEKRNGFNGAFDAANNTIKMAQKRALVSAAISVSGISDMFDQDMENEDFMKGASDIIDTAKEDAPVTAKQIKRLYAIAADLGFNAKQAQDIIIAAGYASTKDIKQKDYDAICKLFSEKAKSGDA